MQHLRQLEDQSVYILREAYKHFDNLAMLWSMGKDSTVLLWLARKAFFGHVPFPLLHVDTSFKIPAMIEYRDRVAREWSLKLVVGQNKEADLLRRILNNQVQGGSCNWVLMNAALILYAAGKGATWAACIPVARRALEEGAAARKLEELTQEPVGTDVTGRTH